MTVSELEDSGNGKKRKRRIGRKLAVNEKVEVRSFEEGFLGSWHCGTVVACKKGVRHVQYDHLLLNDGSDFLVDVVPVSSILDDINSTVENSYFRGYIRPTPPKLEFGHWGLLYGLCVDAYYQDAWWEGVIFDHEDGLEERRIFFPDLGDELKLGINTLRIAQDWDEATGNWQRRGTWSFLELIDQCEQECYLPVSLKQIWYEVRAKKSFTKIGEWTFTVNDLWKKLVMEVINENLDITLKEMSRVFEVPSSAAIERAEANVDIYDNPRVNLVEFDDITTTRDRVKSDMMIGNDNNQKNAFGSRGLIVEEVPNCDISDSKLPDNGQSSSIIHLAQEKSQKDDEPNVQTLNRIGSSGLDEAFPVLPKPLSTLVSETETFSGASSISHPQIPIIKFKFVSKLQECSGHENTFNWKTLSLRDAALCPSAVMDYLSSGEKRPGGNVVKDLRKHLLYLGWKIECRQDKSIFRYITTDGKCFYSLRQVCRHLMEPSAEFHPSVSQNEPRVLPDSRDEIFSSQSIELAERSSSPEQCFLAALHGSDVSGKPEFCHKHVRDYCNWKQLSGSKSNDPELTAKARRNLLSLGWNVSVRDEVKKQRWYYTSPLGRTFQSLLTACKACLEEKERNEPACECEENTCLIKKTEGQFVRNNSYYAPSNMGARERSVPSNSIKMFSGESPCTSTIEGLVNFRNYRFQQSKRCRGKATSFNFKLYGKKHESGVRSAGKKFMRRIRSPSAVKQKLKGNLAVSFGRFADDLKCIRSTRVLRTSKRAREVVTTGPSHHNPRTILSWLIDNNVVLPRAKVSYCSRKGLRPMAEGRVSRDGIKCCCCWKVFTLNGFEIHAGSTLSRPAANIFLEDGRSLLDCQLLCNKKTRNYKKEASDCRKGDSVKRVNDYICSICHFGGILILCDQCPSSFHQSCLGLEDIPEGDWFCPSCCCRICGQNKLNEGTNIVEDPFLTCHQCEHKYHVKCLGIRGIHKCGSHSNPYWFCNQRCEKIHWGLQRLVGKSIPVSGDNLTWSLLKATTPDTHHLKPPNVETLTQNHSKLNVALSVMHECFEPVKEPHTKRDLVEDVIFSSRSELKRLDFQGFYTVLLERNEELISVAVIRVYGEKVAEIPLVGTRFQYRRLGMCRILMNELEKRLRELGVQRLVLPAVSSVLNAWTSSFGFSKMTNSERLEFLHYTFLDFQETVMCQKLLLNNTVVPSSLTGKFKYHDDVSKTSNGYANIDESSAMTEVHQTVQIEESVVASEGHMEMAAGNNSNNSSSQEIIMAELRSHLQSKSSHGDNFPVCSAGDYKRSSDFRESDDDYLKCYKRRRKLVSC